MDLMTRRRMMMIPKKANDSYLTFTALQANSTISMNAVGSAPSVSLEYSVDNGVNWSPFIVGTTIVTLSNIGDNVKLKGINDRIGYTVSQYNVFNMTGEISASGDITSIINGVGGDETLVGRCFMRTFYDCTQLKQAPNLPSTSMGTYGYYQMFRGSGIKSCEINILTVPSNGFYQMFASCSSLNYVLTKMTDISASNCLTNWLNSAEQTGTLVCDSSLVLPSGSSGLPSGWTRMNLDGTPYVEP